MPKFGAHILVAEQAYARRPDLYDGSLNALRLGSIGPDLTLFLFDPVHNPAVRKGYDIAVEVLTAIHQIKETLEKIELIFSEPKADLENWVTGGMSEQLADMASLLMSAGLTAAKLGIVDGFSHINIQNPLPGSVRADIIKDPAHAVPTLIISSADNQGFPLRYFGHPLTQDGNWKTPAKTNDYSSWWWMDMLHYRKPGTFAKQLLSNATNSLTRDYARGYLSHVAGDIVGHPFINSIVGGPFRNHAYRHMVLESLADSLVWKTQRNQDILAADMHKLFEQSNGEIGEIANLLIRTMKQVYVDPQLPNQLPNRYPAKSELVTAYRTMSLYLELSTSGKVSRPKQPPNDPQDLIAEMQKLLAKNMPGYPPRWDSSRSANSIIGLLGYLFRSIIFLLMIATLPEALIAKFLTVGPRWLLYFINLALYQIVSALRVLLALMGWGYAGADDFDNFGYLKDMVTFKGSDNKYPRATADPKVPYYWLIPPTFNAQPELQRTLACVMPPNTRLDWILDPTNKYHPSSVKMLLDAKTPSDTIHAEFVVSESKGIGFGNAPDFLNMILDQLVPVPDLDLDGDRGFGFKPWEELPPNERYL